MSSLVQQAVQSAKARKSRFESLVRRLEVYARRSPGGYRARVALLAGLGYAYILVVLLVVLALLAGVVYMMFTGHINAAEIKILIVLLALAGIILRSLWVTLPAPEGIELTREKTPALFAMVDELRAKLQAGRFDHVLLTDDFNAAAAQIPRLGLFGWQGNYLLFGLPLMFALTPEQLRAVTAHELGHLSGNHGKFGGWIYRLSETWDRLLATLAESRGWATAIFDKFFEWYAPYFEAYSFVLRRQNEYEADRAAAELAGAGAAASALVNVRLRAELLGERFTPQLYKQADTVPVPPTDTFTAMGAALRGELPPDADAWLERALAEPTGYDDTHPSLADRLHAMGFTQPGGGPLPLAERLAAIGFSPADAAALTSRAPHESAAERFLGAALPGLLQKLNQEWHDSIREAWKERHEEAQKAQARLDELAKAAQERELTFEEMRDRASLLAEFRDPAEAISAARFAYAANPTDAHAAYLLGNLLLDDDQEEGITRIEEAMTREPRAIPSGCQRIHAYLQKHGRREEAERYVERAMEGHIQVAMAERQMAQITARDRFEPHGLPPETLASLREQLARFEEVGAAYLVRKTVPEMPTEIAYVLGIVPSTKWYQFKADNADAQLVQRIASALQTDLPLQILSLTGPNAKILGPLRAASSTSLVER